MIDPQQRQVLDLAAWGKTLAGISLEARRSEFETTLLIGQLVDKGLLAIDHFEAGAPETDPVGIILDAAGRRRDAAQGRPLRRRDRGLRAGAEPRRPQPGGEEGPAGGGRRAKKAKTAKKIPLDKIPRLRLTAMALAQQQFDPQEGFVLSRINGQWDVQSILKLCPMPEDDTLMHLPRACSIAR